MPVRRLAAVAFMLSFVVGGCSTSDDSRGTRIAEATPITHPELRDQLNDLFRRDQRARRDMLAAIRNAAPPPHGASYAPEVMPLVDAARAIDRESGVFLHAMIEQHGWPTFAMVGEDGANSAWLLAQHADAQPDLQRKILGLMEPLVTAGQAKPSNFAYLTDRVLVADRQPQVYGTQFCATADGTQRPYPIQNPVTVDQRRARVGIEPMKTYARSLEEITGRPVRVEPMTAYP